MPKTVERMFSGKPQEGDAELREAHSALSTITPDLKATGLRGSEIRTAIEQAFKPSLEDARDKLRDRWKDGLEEKEIDTYFQGPFKELGEVLKKVKGTNPENASSRRRAILSAMHGIQDNPEAMRHVLESIKGWGTT
jgi:hypothetical protein